MARKAGDKSLPMAVFLIGVVLLIEASATMFVLLEAPSAAAGVAWFYVLVKTIVGLYTLLVGFKAIKN